MMTTSKDCDPVTATGDERSALATIEAIIAAPAAEVTLVGADGMTVALPPSMRRLVHTLAQHLAHGEAVTLVPTHKMLTTQQAANILNVSRPYLVHLLDRGEISSTRKTSHRRIRLDDLLAYKRQRDEKRFAGLRELIQMSEEFGLYDDPPQDPHPDS